MYHRTRSCCGCHYTIPADPDSKIQLPLLTSEAHSTILSTSSTTVLKQNFTNPTSDTIKECTYTFPIYDGVSVVGFTCKIGSKTIIGIVKENVAAKKTYDDAVSRGEVAGLLAQQENSDVWTTNLGNIPAGENIVVEITYIGELKHHESDGIRFTIPTYIAPRYGDSDGLAGDASLPRNGDGIKITVDIHMPEGCFIKTVESPSHQTKVSMGTISTQTQSEPTLSRASATLALESAALDRDFVLIIHSKDVGVPKALLETHPAIPKQRAIMATLVPKFSIAPIRPEIVFVADRSGSMRNSIEILVSAMKVFLKSMPAGVKFNICSFGSRNTFLWPQSQTYTGESLNEAMAHLKSFAADFGGTETSDAIKATVEKRLADLPLEIVLLTDGDIRRQQQLFTYLNDQVKVTNGQIRVFSLGIGNGVSHALIEGVARAGNGFAQAVQQGERLEKCVVSMLRGALSPHISNYKLDIKYAEDDDEDFVDIKDHPTMDLTAVENLKLDDEMVEQATPISLFDPDLTQEQLGTEVKAAEVKLPDIQAPLYLQAPYNIPSLYAFSRTTVYVLISPEKYHKNPTAVVLQGTAPDGQVLSIEIPIETLPDKGETIHQLAARKVVQDLEEGRGWLEAGADQDKNRLKEKYTSCFDELVKREAVILGEKYQVAGKYCSFVAVEANDKEAASKVAGLETPFLPKPEPKVDDSMFWNSKRVKKSIPSPGSATGAFSAASNQAWTHGTSNEQRFAMTSAKSSCYITSILRASNSIDVGGRSANAHGLQSPDPPAPMPMLRSTRQPMGMPQTANGAPAMPAMLRGNRGFAARIPKQRSPAPAAVDDSTPDPPAPIDWPTKSVAERVVALIELQAFDGSWSPAPELGAIMGVAVPSERTEAWTTFLVTRWLEVKCANEEAVWEMVVEKAKDRLAEENLEGWEEEVMKLLGGA